MNRPAGDPDDEFFAPVLREPPPPEAESATGKVSDTGVRRARSDGGPPTFG
ncbi:hypothetical protein Nocox_40280 [Nonomuraea coxensis DSM 45129]|uniref:Uncharacterized protein n=1 Tax=Nonomuraea coxensis DSM 45129 TaxID=1122611 RepID=A0ABX8UGS3_9ACTN|nr:hypothetical protein [Nonomuraea coxensis]QYC45599.1 hypothetical protein Nocox_40280 [Nonomuraea coxensis DSM 45129]